MADTDGKMGGWTPGPWQTFQPDGRHWRVQQRGEIPAIIICDMPLWKGAASAEMEANAHLIAAAPALAVAAKPLVDEIQHYKPSAGEDDDELVSVRLGDLKYLRRALRLARGEQQ